MKIRVLILLLGILIQSLAGGVVQGVVLRKSKPVEKPAINRYSGRESLPREQHTGSALQDLSKAIVYLTPKENRNYSTPKVRPKMEQVNEAFQPWLLPVQTGTTVDFPNSDPVFHNVFSYSRSKKFDLGRYPKGESKSVTFDKPGLIKVFCEIHSSMRAYILVLEHPYFTVSGSDGRFTIPDLPEGKYTLHVWQENLPEITRPVEISNQDTLFLEIR